MFNLVKIQNTRARNDSIHAVGLQYLSIYLSLGPSHVPAFKLYSITTYLILELRGVESFFILCIIITQVMEASVSVFILVLFLFLT